METNSRGNARGRRWRLLVGYNLPLALWTVFAIVGPQLGGRVRWPCPLDTAVGWCPGCGLTSTYGQFLRGQGLPNGWLGIVLAGFAANAIWSVVKAQHLLAVPPRRHQPALHGRILAAPKGPNND
jgi:hypothetical protein